MLLLTVSADTQRVAEHRYVDVGGRDAWNRCGNHELLRRFPDVQRQTGRHPGSGNSRMWSDEALFEKIVHCLAQADDISPRIPAGGAHSGSLPFRLAVRNVTLP